MKKGDSLEIKIRKIKKDITPRKKWPTFWQWKNFFKILKRKEKFYFFGLFIIAILSVTILISSLYYKNTEVVAAEGGTFIEGVLSQTQPRFVNPVYANSDIDRDLTELIFSGLMKYSPEMDILPDLARDYPELEDEGRAYKFYLKENLLWQDGTPLTADDIVFTIKTIQNPDFKSPYLANWVGVKVEKINDLTVKFTLQKAYAGFLENCTIKILPKHIWEEVPLENFAFDPHNLEQSIGSGKYKVKEVKRENSGEINYLVLEKNNLYLGESPYIEEVKFLFFDNLKNLISAAKKGKITGANLKSDENISGNWQNNQLSLPRYFAVFFNKEKSKILAEENVRLALSYATNKKEISEKSIESPILPNFYGFENPEIIYEFNLEKAKLLIEELGFKDENGDGILEKKVQKELAFTFKSRLVVGSKGNEVTELQKCLQGQTTGYFGPATKQLVIDFQDKYAEDILTPAGLSKGTGTVGPSTRAKLNEICFGDPDETLELKINLVTINQAQMIETANILKEQWSKIGVTVEIQPYSLFQLEQDFLKPRNYDCLLFGEVLGAIPDPFPFWHSSQVNDPGLNLSLYENKIVDELLEENRKLSETEERKEKLEEFQNILIEDNPAIFLYSPDYSYFTSSQVKGVTSKKLVDPSKRFLDIENWYIKIKKIWKH